jgi:hypothetical protein
MTRNQGQTTFFRRYCPPDKGGVTPAYAGGTGGLLLAEIVVCPRFRC